MIEKHEGARFDAQPIVAYLGLRAIPEMERVSSLRYERWVTSSEGSARVRFDFSSAFRGEVTATLVSGDMSRSSLSACLERIAHLSSDARQAHQVLRRDCSLRPFLGPEPIRIPGCVDPFELAVRAIVGQQISVRAAARMVARLASRFGQRINPSREPALAFPTATTLQRAPVEEIGLPIARAGAVRTLARAVVDGHIDLTASASSSVSTELRQIKGIGPWTSAYIQLRGLGNGDAMPFSDAGLRARLGDEVPLTAAEVEERARDWIPWRGFVATLVWNSFLRDPVVARPYR